jgi:hypothetical protein
MRQQIIQKIVYPISDGTIFKCDRYFCLCIEYLDFSKKKDVSYYKQCMITAMKNDRRPHKINRLIK